MRVLDIVTRIDAICKKYECYDTDDLNKSSFTGGDAFTRVYAVIESDFDSENAELVSHQKERAAVVALNVKILRAKSRLLKQVPALKILDKEKTASLSFEEVAARNDLVQALHERIQAIPHLECPSVEKTSGRWASAAQQIAELDSALHYEYINEEARQFRQKYKLQKLKQD